MNAIDELLDLLLPTKCALCPRLGSPICNQCRENFQAVESSVSRGQLNGLVVASFASDSQSILHAFKENGQTALAGFLADTMVSSLLRLAESGQSPLLVPVPSSAANYKKRGFKPTRVLAKRLCRASGQACALTDSLSFKRIVADQAQLDAEARKANLADSMVADSLVAGREVILFDDVVTTGSTLIEAARAVTLAGGKVIGFLAFAETILKTKLKS